LIGPQTFGPGGPCQSNVRWCVIGVTSPFVSDDLRRKRAPLSQRGRALLLVGLPCDQIPLLIEMIVELGVD